MAQTKTTKKFMLIDLVFYLPMGFVIGLLFYGFTLIPTAVLHHKPVPVIQVPIAIVADCIALYFICRQPVEDFEEKNIAAEEKEIEKQ